MAKYKYVGNGAFFQGLPTTDVDDAELSEEQKGLLEMGVTAGLYVKEDELPHPQRAFAEVVDKLTSPVQVESAADDLKKSAPEQSS